VADISFLTPLAGAAAANVAVESQRYDVAVTDPAGVWITQLQRLLLPINLGTSPSTNSDILVSIFDKATVNAQGTNPLGSARFPGGVPPSAPTVQSRNLASPIFVTNGGQLAFASDPGASTNGFTYRFYGRQVNTGEPALFAANTNGGLVSGSGGGYYGYGPYPATAVNSPFFDCLTDHGFVYRSGSTAGVLADPGIAPAGGTTIVTLRGVTTHFAAGMTATLSGIAGATAGAMTVISATLATVPIALGSAVGDLVITPSTDPGLSATLSVFAPSIYGSIGAASPNATVNVDLNGFGTHFAAGMTFPVNGGTNASATLVSVTSPTLARASLITGTTPGTLAIATSTDPGLTATVLLPAAAPSPASVVAGTTTTINILGAPSRFSQGLAFSVAGGTGARVNGTTIADATHGSVPLIAGTAPGPLTLTPSYDPSAAVTVTVTAAAPAAPAPPTGLAAAPVDGGATLTWADAAAGTAYTGVNVYQGTVAGGESAAPIATLGPAATSYTATGLANGTPYFFTVKAVAGSTLSAASNEATATPAAPSSPGNVALAAAANFCPSGQGLAMVATLSGSTGAMAGSVAGAGSVPPSIASGVGFSYSAPPTGSGTDVVTVSHGTASATFAIQYGPGAGYTDNLQCFDRATGAALAVTDLVATLSRFPAAATLVYDPTHVAPGQTAGSYLFGCWVPSGSSFNAEYTSALTPAANQVNSYNPTASPVATGGANTPGDNAILAILSAARQAKIDSIGGPVASVAAPVNLPSTAPPGYGGGAGSFPAAAPPNWIASAAFAPGATVPRVALVDATTALTNAVALPAAPAGYGPPADYQQRGVAVTLPAAPGGYGGSGGAGPTVQQIAAAILLAPGQPIATDALGRVTPAVVTPAGPSVVQIAGAILAAGSTPIATDAAGRVTPTTDVPLTTGTVTAVAGAPAYAAAVTAPGFSPTVDAYKGQHLYVLTSAGNLNALRQSPAIAGYAFAAGVATFTFAAAPALAAGDVVTVGP